MTITLHFNKWVFVSPVWIMCYYFFFNIVATGKIYLSSTGDRELQNYIATLKYYRKTGVGTTAYTFSGCDVYCSVKPQNIRNRYIQCNPFGDNGHQQSRDFEALKN